MATATTAADHLAWCKRRANEYLDAGKIREAFASMASDLNKHDETRGHSAINLGMLGGELETVEKMREFIDGFN